jgi:polysaccharide deacetylase 2 family uncharacterized protein YibQ
MVFDAYRQATAATRGSGMPGLVATAAVVAAAVIGTAVWLFVTGPVAPPRVAVPLPKPVPVPLPVVAANVPAPPSQPESILDQPLGTQRLGVGSDGKVPWQSNARAFDKTDRRPKVALVIDALGASATITDGAIRSLPGGVTLGFMPYWKAVAQWLSLAREAGHEALLDLPMEPPDASHIDLGPNGLRTALDGPANTQRLEWMILQANGYVGFIGYEGGRFSAERDAMQPVLADLRKHGLLYIDNRASAQSVAGSVATQLGLPFAPITRRIDADPSRDAVDLRLRELEEIARRDGSAIGLAQAEPSVIERVAAWSQTLEARGFALAPVSAVVTVAAPPSPALGPVAAKPTPAEKN